MVAVVVAEVVLREHLVVAAAVAVAVASLAAALSRWLAPRSRAFGKRLEFERQPLRQQECYIVQRKASDQERLKTVTACLRAERNR